MKKIKLRIAHFYKKKQTVQHHGRPAHGAIYTRYEILSINVKLQIIGIPRKTSTYAARPTVLPTLTRKKGVMTKSAAVWTDISKAPKLQEFSASNA
jgi:hypothetical protein